MAAGTVKWFNEASGYGFIVPDEGDGDMYVRAGNIARPGRATLSVGGRVEFDGEPDGSGGDRSGPAGTGAEAGRRPKRRLIVFGSNVQPKRRVRAAVARVVLCLPRQVAARIPNALS